MPARSLVKLNHRFLRWIIALLVLVTAAAACARSAPPPPGEAPPTKEAAEEEATAEEEEAEEKEEAPTPTPAPTATLAVETAQAAASATVTSVGGEPGSEGVEVAFEGETGLQGEDTVTSGVLSLETLGAEATELGVGTVDATAPADLDVGETGTVRVEIAPLYDPEDVQVESFVTVTAVEEPVEVLNFYDELRLYSVMSARISAPGFEVQTSTPEVQRLSADVPALWAWNVLAREPGRRSVTVSISVPVIIDGEVQDIATSPLRTIEFIIEVTRPPSPTAVPLPTPTPTPVPSFVSRTLNEMGPEVVAGIILAVLGAIGSFVWSRIRKSDDKPNKK